MTRYMKDFKLVEENRVWRQGKKSYNNLRISGYHWHELISSSPSYFCFFLSFFLDIRNSRENCTCISNHTRSFQLIRGTTTQEAREIKKNSQQLYRQVQFRLQQERDYLFFIRKSFYLI